MEMAICNLLLTAQPLHVTRHGAGGGVGGGVKCTTFLRDVYFLKHLVLIWSNLTLTDSD